MRDFLQNRLNIDGNNIYLTRAHRTGKFVRNRYQARPIIVNFRDYNDTEYIMSKVRLLKGTKQSIDYDYPREIQEARSRLWPKLKELRKQYPEAKSVIIYPAKLLHNGRIVLDELPDWNKYVGANRIQMVEQIQQVSQQRTAQPRPPNVLLKDIEAERREVLNSVRMELQAQQYEQPVDLSSCRKHVGLGNANAVHNEVLRPAVFHQPQTQAPENVFARTCIPTSVLSATSEPYIPTEMEVTPSPTVRHTESLQQVGVPLPHTVAVCQSQVPALQALPLVAGSNNTGTATGDETSVKALHCDATNPRLQSDADDTSRSRSRSRRTELKAEQRALSRSRSSAPYTRQNSKTRISQQTINSPSVLSDNNTGTEVGHTLGTDSGGIPTMNKDCPPQHVSTEHGVTN